MYLKNLDKVAVSFFLFIFLIIFGFTYFQIQSHHWSSGKPFDLTSIYNSLLIVSGYYQEFRDLPSFTQFFLHGSIYKLVSFLDTDIPRNIEIYLNSDNKDIVIQKLFIISRYLNSFFYFIFCIYFFKLLNFYKVNKLFIYLSILFLFTIDSIIYGLTRIRPDVLCILFFTLSYYNLQLFFKIKKINLLFLSGLFLFLSLMSKIQAILFFPLILLNIIFNIKEIKNKDLNKFNYRFDLNIKYIFLFFLILYLSYFFLQIYINNHPRFVSSNFIDLKIITISAILFTIFINIFYNNSKHKYLTIKILFYFIISFIASLLLFQFLNLINIIKLSPYILLRLTNPFSYLTIATTLVNGESNIFSVYFFKLFSLANINFNIFLFYFFQIIFGFYFIYNFYKLKKINFYLLCLFLFFNFIILTYNFRYFTLYSIYSFFFFFFITGIFLNYINSKKIKYFMIVVIFVLTSFPKEVSPTKSIFFNFQSFYIDYFKKESKLKLICKTKKLRFKYWWWARKHDENFWKSICEQNNYKFLDTNKIIKEIY